MINYDVDLMQNYFYNRSAELLGGEMIDERDFLSYMGSCLKLVDCTK